MSIFSSYFQMQFIALLIRHDIIYLITSHLFLHCLVRHDIIYLITSRPPKAGVMLYVELIYIMSWDTKDEKIVL